jgi:hypothetical protein
VIPAIGIMIGFYTITKFFAFLLRKEPRNEHVFIKVLSGVAIGVTIICMISLLVSSAQSASLLDYY